MRNRKRVQAKSSRRAATVVLMALMIVFLAGMVAFGVDVGFIVLVKTQLQTAADSSAMAAAAFMGSNPEGVYDKAQEYASKHVAGGIPVDLATTDVEFGTWDIESRIFTPSDPPGTVGNAIRVTARRPNAPMFFGQVFGAGQFDTQASAVAMNNPRDIVFVVDLSGSMNDDTDAVWATSTIDSNFANESPSAGTALMEKVYADFNFGAYPGTSQYIGAGLSGVSTSSSAYAEMTGNYGPLAQSGVAADFRISSSDSESVRKQKAYSWIMENQIKTIMPNAVPPPNYADADSLAYWSKYIDYVIVQTYRSSGYYGSNVPPNVDTNRQVDDFNNPNRSNYPSASSSLPQAFQNYIGYQTYVSFMMDWGATASRSRANTRRCRYTARIVRSTRK